ncbi:hypothetical protein PsorP6_000755 [Peronosclerospora sorghi]|uniref:Uncharacterized protein n=1 Tax=Peronosclerospora sorghi TaxID=230839 RepID=A0ACC0WS27_9STRA|nr:hypothetical protein PsorP6_000755 [Peronosclerospora sorghi]
MPATRNLDIKRASEYSTPKFATRSSDAGKRRYRTHPGPSSTPTGTLAVNALIFMFSALMNLKHTELHIKYWRRKILYYVHKSNLWTRREGRSAPQANRELQVFKAPFRTDNYLSRLTGQHPQRWQSYAKLSAEDKKTYFDGIVPFKASLHSHFGQSETVLHFRIRRIIVDVVIGEMLFHPDDVGDETKERALRTFTKGDQQVVVEGEAWNNFYEVRVQKFKQFDLAIGFIGNGASFRQAASFIQLTKEKTGLASFRSKNMVSPEDFPPDFAGTDVNVGRRLRGVEDRDFDKENGLDVFIKSLKWKKATSTKREALTSL